MAALHRPLYKVSFHLGATRGGRLMTGGFSPPPPLATPLDGGDDKYPNDGDGDDNVND